VYEIGGRRGAAADLLCPLDDPDAAVAEAMADTLGWYRGKTAREMLLRLCDHPADSVRELSARSLDYLSDIGALSVDGR
jgi:HEAT repeat protein